MAQTLSLKVVLELTGSQVSDSVSDSGQAIVHCWPGDPLSLNISIPPSKIDPVWIAVNADCSAAKWFPADTPVADILGEGWAHLYQGTMIHDSDGNANVYSNQYNHVLLAIASCCNNSFPTEVLALKQSRYPLTPGQTYPCQAEAIFKWLAIKGKTETRPNLQYVFSIQMVNAALDVSLASTQISTGPLTTTTQMALSWPEDFVGLIIDGVTLVANDTVPMTGERQVKDFDGGQVAVEVRIDDPDVPETVANTTEIFALPDTDCLQNSSQIFEEEFETQFE